MEVESGHLCLSSMLQKAGFYSTESLMRLSCRMCWLGNGGQEKKVKHHSFAMCVCNVGRMWITCW